MELTLAIAVAGVMLGWGWLILRPRTFHSSQIC